MLDAKSLKNHYLIIKILRDFEFWTGNITKLIQSVLKVLIQVRHIATIKYVIPPTLPLPFEDVGFLFSISHVQDHEGKSLKTFDVLIQDKHFGTAC